MKEIKSKRYIQLQKRGQINMGLPGDSSLPPGVDQRMIDEHFESPEEDIVTNSGETEVEVNWPDFSQWYISGGEPLPAPFDHYQDKSIVTLYYKYQYDYGLDESSDISPIRATEYRNGQVIPITDQDLVDALFEYDPYVDKIKHDIKVVEEDNKIQRDSGIDTHDPDFL